MRAPERADCSMCFPAWVARGCPPASSDLGPRVLTDQQLSARIAAEESKRQRRQRIQRDARHQREGWRATFQYSGFDNWTRDKVGGVVAAALAAWTRQDAYLVELQVGAPRIDLNGQVAGVVSEREKAHAIELLDEIDKHGAPKSWNLEPWDVAAARRLWRSLTRSNNAL
jgi:hypothetical protein